jgi:hypothetical protein
MNKTNIFTTILSAVLLTFLHSQNAAAFAPSLEISLPVVEIGTFYNGTTLAVQGEIPGNAEALIRISGEGEELHLKKKGKAAGMFWMNTGDLTFEHVPRVYLQYATPALADKLESPAANLGFGALRDQVEIKPAGEDDNFLFKEFVRLKEKQSLYGVFTDAVNYGIAKDGVKAVKATLVIPPGMQKGEYKIELYAVVDGAKVVGKAEKALTIKQIDFPAQLTKLAFDRPLLHGVLAVLIAIGAGLLTGILFKGKGGAH